MNDLFLREKKKKKKAWSRTYKRDGCVLPQGKIDERIRSRLTHYDEREVRIYTKTNSISVDFHFVGHKKKIFF
jgi:hypothetical protein